MHLPDKPKLNSHGRVRQDEQQRCIGQRRSRSGHALFFFFVYTRGTRPHSSSHHMTERNITAVKWGEKEAHHCMVTRLPNHWWASSCVMTEHTRCRCWLDAWACNHPQRGGWRSMGHGAWGIERRDGTVGRRSRLGCRQVRQSRIWRRNNDRGPRIKKTNTTRIRSIHSQADARRLNTRGGSRDASIRLATRPNRPPPPPLPPRANAPQLLRAEPERTHIYTYHNRQNPPARPSFA